MLKKDRPIRVLHIANTDFFIVRLMSAKLRLLCELGYDVSVAAPKTAGEEVDLGPDIAYYDLPIPREIHVRQDLSAYSAIKAHLSEHSYDIVHTHSAKAGFLGRLAAHKMQVKCILHTVHGLPFYEGQTAFTYNLYRFLERFAQKRGDLLLSQNREDMQKMLDAKLAKPDDIRFEGNGIDIAAIRTAAAQADTTALRQELRLTGPVIGYFARIEPVKGHLVFIEAFKDLLRTYPDAICLLAGSNMGFDSDYAVNVHAKLHEDIPEGNVRVLGFRKDIEALTSVCDIVCLPSEKEGIPRILMEAMALGKPVVATDVPGTRELVVSGETGLLVPYGDSEGLSAALCRVLGDKALANAFGSAGSARVEAEFDERVVAGRLDGIYRELLERKGLRM